ncbi:MAG: hypothetical protein ACI7YS_17195 [Flavobacterium sp.]
MRKLFVILSVIFTVLGITFSILPFDTLAFFPLGLALTFCLLILKKSQDNQKKLPKILLFLCALSSAFVVGKTLLVKDKVVQDKKFEQQKTETKIEAKKELEELENDLE